MYQVKFIDDPSLLPKAIETIEIGKSLGAKQWHCDLLVFQNENAFLHLACFGDSLECLFTQEALVWSDWIVVGFGHRVYLYEPRNHVSKVIDLGAYFCKLHPTANILFACSGEYIHALNLQGELLWVSEMLGIDGVIINEITDDLLLGEGEWDPPNGWKPFKIQIVDGTVNWL